MQGLDLTALLLGLVQVTENAVHLEGPLHGSECVCDGVGAVFDGVDLLVVVGDARNHILPCVPFCKTLPELGVVREAFV